MKASSVLSTALALGWSLAAEYSNPLRNEWGGDPHIVYHDGYYYFMSTNWENLQMTRATTLEGLKTGETKLVWEDSDPSRCCNVWAPEMHFVHGAWHIYYAAGTEGDDYANQRAHVIAGGATPWDDYSYLGQIREDWSIDGTILNVNDQDYFVYSGFDPQGLQSLLIAPLTGPASTGEAALLSVPTEDWEVVGGSVNEGAFALYRGNRTMLSFSASQCATPAYSLGILTYDGGDPMDSASWTKTGPEFSAANGEYGTGHNTFFTSPDGSEIWNVYHSTPSSGGDCYINRYSNAKVMQFDENNYPIFGEPTGYDVVLPGPSGE